MVGSYRVWSCFECLDWTLTQDQCDRTLYDGFGSLAYGLCIERKQRLAREGSAPSIGAENRSSSSTHQAGVRRVATRVLHRTGDKVVGKRDGNVALTCGLIRLANGSDASSEERSLSRMRNISPVRVDRMLVISLRPMALGCLGHPSLHSAPEDSCAQSSPSPCSSSAAPYRRPQPFRRIPG